MVTVERAKGRIERLYIAMQKSDITKERMSEYEGSVGFYKSMLIGQIGQAEADKFIHSLQKQLAMIMEA